MVKGVKTAGETKIDDAFASQLGLKDLDQLKGLIRDTDRRIREAFEQTFEAAAKNFEDVVEHLFPGGRGRLRLVQAEVGPRPAAGQHGRALGNRVLHVRGIPVAVVG